MDADKSLRGSALLGKLFLLLDFVGARPGQLSVADLMRETGWPRATIYRIVSTATNSGYLRLDPISKGYTLGFRFMELAQNVWSSGDLVTTAAAELRRLRDITGETAHLAVLQGLHTLALGKFDSPHPHKRAEPSLGEQKSMHATSQGKAILAYLPEAEADIMIARFNFRRSTPYTIVEPELLKAQLRIIRQRGFAVDDEEAQVGTRCVGAPVLNRHGRPVAVISISGPTYRVTSDRVERLGPEVAQVAQDIGHILNETFNPSQHSSDWPSDHPGHHVPALFGTSPVWDERRQVLHWADQLAPRLHSTAARATQSQDINFNDRIDAVACTRNEVVVFSNGRRLQVGADAEVRETEVRALQNMKSIAVHPDGQPYGALFSESEGMTSIGVITPAGEISAEWRLTAQVAQMAWSADGETLYASVPERGLIYALTKGAASPKILARISKASGEPLGLAVDRLGRVWVALYDGWSIARLSADGRIEQVLALPVPRPTGIAFSGQSADTLHITTARIDLSREVLENAPLSGRLLVAETGAEGFVPPPMNYAPGD